MKLKNTISRINLTAIRKVSDCSSWTSRIDKYLSSDSADLITLSNEDIIYAITNGTNIQKESLEKAGVSMDENNLYPELKSYKDACKILKIVADAKSTVEQKIRAIVKAANYLDNNNKIWKPNLKDSSKYKYAPYLYYSSGGSWVLRSYDWYSSHHYPGELYYKQDSTCRIISKRFSTLYLKWFNS